MFTGIIEELGIVKAIDKAKGKVILSVENSTLFSQAKVNDSIAVNGCCLTIVAIENNIASFDILPESLSRTNLNTLNKSSLVNLEASLTMQTKLGGHILQGHVDCTAVVKDIRVSGDSSIFSFNLPEEFLSMLVPKAFISIDGISLTIVTVTNNSFSVMVIPHTKKITTAKNWSIGSLVNVEVDIINKSIFHYLKNLKIVN